MGSLRQEDDATTAHAHIVDGLLDGMGGTMLPRGISWLGLGDGGAASDGVAGEATVMAWWLSMGGRS